MDVRQLRYFMAVAEERHITRAAEKLGIQQPPLSRFIKNIEAELDVRLFTRTPRGVELTEAGQAFHDEARKVLAGLENAIEAARSTARGERGRLCVGVTPTGPFVTLVPRVMHEFRQAFPSVSFTLEERLSGELIDLLRNGRVDACFLWTPRAEGLVNTPLLHDPLVVALPSVHPLAQPPSTLMIGPRSGNSFSRTNGVKQT